MQHEFDLDPGVIYLNHAAVAPWPTRTARAVVDFAQQNRRFGAWHYPRWLRVEARLRKHLAVLIGAPSVDDIALLKNTSEALSVIAAGLDWRAGDNVVSFSGEFPSNRIVWEALTRQGVELRLADIGAIDPEAELIACCDADTRLVSVSSVQYASGLRVDIERIGEYCNARGILLCVDAIQSLGALPFDARAIGADFVVADGHKWMLGPEGLALFYSRSAARDMLSLHQFGWHMVEQVGGFDRSEWQPADSARRFECGSPNMLAIHALEASLSLLLEVGMAKVAEHIADRTQAMLDHIDRRGFALLSPRRPSRRSGIVTFHVPRTDSQRLYDALMQQGVVCACRGGGVRFSPHFHTSLDGIEEAFGQIDRILLTGQSNRSS